MSDSKKDWAQVQETDIDTEISSDNEFDVSTMSSSDASPDVGEKISGVLEHPSYLAMLEELNNTEKLLNEAREEGLRHRAAAETAARRAQDAVTKAHQFGQVKLVEAILPIIDSLEHAENACKNLPQEQANVGEGVSLTLKLLQDTLTKFNVTVIEPMGDVFDPNRHEAMAMQEVPGATPNTVVGILQKGYCLHERVIRPARVMIAKAPS